MDYRDYDAQPSTPHRAGGLRNPHPTREWRLVRNIKGMNFTVWIPACAGMVRMGSRIGGLVVSFMGEDKDNGRLDGGG